MARILLVGAYERDNVGDLLFLHVTEPYLRGAEVVAAAPFAADMTALLDREVPAYGPLLRRGGFDAVWTVGGQVGAIDARRAFRLAAAPATWRRFHHASAPRQARILRRSAGGPPPFAPYIPEVDGPVTVVNSAGLNGIADAEPERRDRLVELIRSRTHVAVRDPDSHELLDELGIAHAFAPDVVHALPLHHPVARPPAPDTAIVQVSSAILTRLGHADVAAALAGSRALDGLKLRFLAAGLATGHDRLSDYADLVARLPGRDATVIDDRRPLDIAAHIARARVVIGTSLHVRVVAAAYGVPRVSLARRKVSRYAAHWDSGMPYGVRLTGLDRAVARALAGDPDASHLTRAADEHQRALADRVLRVAA